jgi:hypothetical protein
MNKPANLEDQIQEVKREIDMRVQNYSKFLSKGQIRGGEEAAIRQMKLMEDVLATLEALQ